MIDRVLTYDYLPNWESNTMVGDAFLPFWVGFSTRLGESREFPTFLG